jgi:hypothetical protein
MTTKWNIPGLTLTFSAEGNGLSEQTIEFNLLSSLAKISYPQIAQCCLDIIFRIGYCTDTNDALNAYATAPLSEPPGEYRNMFDSVDWSTGPSNAHLYAIILAGSKTPSDREKLVRIISIGRRGMCEAAIYAASSYADRTVIETVGRVAVQTDLYEDCSTALSSCFNRWIDRKIIAEDELKQMVLSFDESRNKFRTKYLWNSLVCPGWESLPYREQDVISLR